jgi:hypothetical protein
MATNATNPTPGRTARFIHWLFPSRPQVAISLAADVSLAILGLPLWLHLALGLVLHLALHLVWRLR